MRRLLRGEGGWVLLPPSEVTDGSQYTVKVKSIAGGWLDG